MDVLYERCCGLDVHKKTVVACLLTPSRKQTRTFGTMTADLRELAQWLQAEGCTHVAMESTGVYWKPIYNILEEHPEGTRLTVLVVTARHFKAVPGRKTDVKDAEWLADLLRHGLLRGSFIPDREQRELQELIRYRRSLVDERSREANRIHKVLEGANIKLAGVISDILGVSGRAMLTALAAGTTDPAELARLADGRLKATATDLQRALEGTVGAHQQMLLATQLEHIDFLNERIAALETQVDQRLEPYTTQVALLDGIAGVGPRVAQEIIAAIGTDMSRFPTEKHISSWAKVCPGNHQSGGKRMSASTGRGNPYLRAALIEAARAAVRTKDSHLRAFYYRVKARRGEKRAIMAVAHKILIIAYYLLKTGALYEDLGADYYITQDAERIERRLVRQLERLGKKVTLEPAVKPAA